jgi:glycosyltransferase involved in cell wall biosynthesis
LFDEDKMPTALNESKKPNISVVLPAHNEAKNLPILIPQIYETFEKHKISGEVILVNDGSMDKTAAIAENLAKKYKTLKVYHHLRNKGITQAFKTAFQHVEGDIIVFLPTDLQSDPREDIPKLLNKMKEGYDMVTGWRAQWNRPKRKIWESKFYSLLSRKMFGVNIHDFNWIRAFKKEIINDVTLRKDWHRYFVVLAASKGYKIGEVKVTEYGRKGGKSKFNFMRVITGFFDMLAVKFYLTFTDRPLILFALPGLISFVLGILLGAYLFFLWLVYGIGTKLMLGFLMLIFISLGVQLWV